MCSGNSPNTSYLTLSKQSATAVRLESIITSLVFDHALRIRLKSEGPANISTNPATDTSGTAVETTEERENVAGVVEGEDLIGKMNNLVTSDLDNITGGRDFLLICKSLP